MGSRCESCVYSGYPQDYGPTRKIVAVCVTVSAVVIVVVGLYLFWMRRHSYIIVKRDWTATVLTSCCVILGFETPFREYFGEGSTLCAVKFADNYLLSALIPSLIVGRCAGLYTRHLRQLVVGSEPTELRSHTPGATDRDVRSWHATLDRVLLNYRMDTPLQLRRLVGWWLVPWAIYYLVRLGTSPEYRTASVGCQLGVIDAILSILGGLLACACIIPLLARLWRQRDALYLRAEIFALMGSWFFLLVWFIYGLVVPSTDFEVINSGYSILFGNIASVIACTWMPAIMTFWDASQTAQSSIVDQLNVTTTDPNQSPIANESLPGQIDLPNTVASSKTPSDLHVKTVEATVSDTNLSFAYAKAHSRYEVTVGSLPPLTTQDTANDTAQRVVGPLASADSGLIVTVRHSDVDAVSSRSRAGRSAVLASLRRVSAEGVGVPRRSVRGLALPSLSAPQSTNVVHSLVISEFIQPAPSMSEITTILHQPAQSILGDARKLRVIGGLLVSSESGRRILKDFLRLEFNTELLGFILACADVRAKLIILQNDAMPTNGQVVEAHESYRARLATIAEYHDMFSRLMAQFIGSSAPSQINTSDAQARALHQAAAAMVAQQAGAEASASDALVSCRAAFRALCVVEREVFRLLIGGPVYRMVHAPDVFVKCVAAISAELGLSEGGPRIADPDEFQGIPGQVQEN